jgi:hypothetical protein
MTQKVDNVEPMDEDDDLDLMNPMDEEDTGAACNHAFFAP